MASAGSRPRDLSRMAKSTSMIAFLVTMPNSIRIPMTTGSEIASPVSHSAIIAPPNESGSVRRIDTGSRNEPKSSTRTP